MPRRRKTNYELSRSQVETPSDVVKLFWSLFGRYRTRVSSVLDVGAGDARFAIGGKYKSYLGIEIDNSRSAVSNLPKNAELKYQCAFDNKDEGFSACIGNPPYVRHHDLDPIWRDKISDSISSESDVALNRKCNLYIYFMFLSLFKTSRNGICAFIVPFEWLSRPSAAPLRDFIKKNDWKVDAYRFESKIFEGVDTTASISIIDKRDKSGMWSFFSVDDQGNSNSASQVTGSRRRVIEYQDRGAIWAMRGMSPGTQKVFTLSEGERIHAGLRKSDVYPCVTSLKFLPQNISTLTSKVFEKRFIDAGQKCWLVKCDTDPLTSRVSDYLNHVPEELRDTATCNNRDVWYKFSRSRTPEILVSSGFVGSSPKTVINSIGASAIGAVHGVYDVPNGKLRPLQSYLATTKFADRIVSHSGRLRKLEVKQLNAILKEFLLKAA